MKTESEHLHKKPEKVSRRLDSLLANGELTTKYLYFIYSCLEKGDDYSFVEKFVRNKTNLKKKFIV